VIPYGTWVPIAVKHVANCYTQLLYFILYHSERGYLAYVG